MSIRQEKQSVSITALGLVLVALAVATSYGLVVGTAKADAASHRGSHSALSLISKPAAVEEDSDTILAGKVTGPLPSSPHHPYRVSLQIRSNGHYATISSDRVRKRRFEVHFAAPHRSETVSLRLGLWRGGKEVVHTKSWRLFVRGRTSTGAQTPKGQSPSPPPGPEKKTLVLSPGKIVGAPAPGEPGTLRVIGVGDVNPGDIIAVGIGPVTPYGFLGRVVAVAQEGGELVLQTVPAELPEALPEGEFDQEIQGEEFDSASPSAASAAIDAPRASTGPETIVQQVATKISCSADAKVEVSGSVAVNPKIEISGGWGPFSGLHAKFVGSVSASSELAALAQAAASCKVGPQTLFKKTLRPVEFSVGPIPVVVVPVLSATLSADGEVEASVESEVHGSITAKAGVEYAHGGAHPIAGFDQNFGWTPPNPSGTAHLEAKISPTLDLLVYGAGGPSATFNAGLAVDADTAADPAWTLTAPISLTAKLSVPALGISTGSFTVYQHSFLLAQAGDQGVQGQIHFDEWPEGTTITDQYSGAGVVFDSPVFISQDGSNPTSPVLSGEPQFEGPIVGHFVVPGTNTPTTVNLLELDAGYINNPGSVEIVAHLANGQIRTAVADHLGIDQISIATRGIQSFTVQEVGAEDAGFAIDNLGFSQ